MSMLLEAFQKEQQQTAVSRRTPTSMLFPTALQIPPCPCVVLMLHGIAKACSSYRDLPVVAGSFINEAAVKACVYGRSARCRRLSFPFQVVNTIVGGRKRKALRKPFIGVFLYMRIACSH